MVNSDSKTGQHEALKVPLISKALLISTVYEDDDGAEFRTHFVPAL
jgi:hypothetical protein